MSRPVTLLPADKARRMQNAVAYLQPVADAAKRVVKNPSPRNLASLKRKLGEYDRNAVKVETDGW